MGKKHSVIFFFLLKTNVVPLGKCWFALAGFSIVLLMTVAVEYPLSKSVIVGYI